MQTVKPRARPVRFESAGIALQGWRVRFPGWGVGFVAQDLPDAVDLAYRMRMFRVLNGGCAPAQP